MIPDKKARPNRDAPKVLTYRFDCRGFRTGIVSTTEVDDWRLASLTGLNLPVIALRPILKDFFDITAPIYAASISMPGFRQRIPARLETGVWRIFRLLHPRELIEHRTSRCLAASRKTYYVSSIVRETLGRSQRSRVRPLIEFGFLPRKQQYIIDSEARAQVCLGVIATDFVKNLLQLHQ